MTPLLSPELIRGTLYWTLLLPDTPTVNSTDL